MSWTPRARTLTILLLSITAAGAASAVDGPRGVSPGSVGRVAVMRDGCTTFSWQEVEGASGYELVAYELAEDAAVDTGLDPEQVREVLFVRLPGGVTSWTPEVSECLAPGGRYAWFVRAVFDAETGEATDWSAPLLFAIPGTPSLAEVEQALDVLLRYVEVGGESEGRARGGPDRREIANLARSATAKVTSRSVQTGTAAIRGEQPDSSGETYGVVGTSASPDGAGIGAANTAGGPDLVLDGSAAGASDAELSEGGIDRPSASAQTFTVGNSGGGGMTLQVDGVEVVTTATDQDTVGALSCAANEIAKFIGGVWVCAPDVDTDTDTLGNLMCASGEVAEWDGHHWSCAPDNDTLAELSCGRNEIAKWNDLGGVWECANDENTTYSPGTGLLIENGQITLDPAWFQPIITTVDSPGNVGEFTSLAIGTDGLGLISYVDVTRGGLQVAHCDNALCTAFSRTELDSGCALPEPSRISITIGSDGYGLIAYFGCGGSTLKTAHCNNFECTSADIYDLGVVGEDPSITLGADNLGLISYYDAAQGLLVGRCLNVACSSISSQLVDSGNVGLDSSIAIGSDGFGIVSYRDQSTQHLKVAHCLNLGCSSATVGTVDATGNVGLQTSIAIGVDGFPIISHFDVTWTDLRIFHCLNVACSTGSVNSLEPTDVAGRFSSIAIGVDGLPVISYLADLSNDLKVAHCNDVSCHSAAIREVDTVGNVGYYTSIGIGADGLPLISYYDSSNQDLKVVHLPYGY